MDLGQQVGPLPLGGWIAVVVGGLGIAYFINRNQAESSSEAQLVPSGVGTGGAQVIETPPEETETDAPELDNTNANWGRQATDWLIGQGNDPGIADNAIRKYLSSMKLDSQEQGLVDQALREFGSPPEPLAPVREVEQPPEAPDALRDVGMWRSGGVNGLYWTTPGATTAHNEITHTNIDIKGSDGYEFNTDRTSIPGGVSHRYTHYAPPGASRGVTYTYTLTPMNNDLAGPKTVLRGKFAINGRLPSVSPAS